MTSNVNGSGLTTGDIIIMNENYLNELEQLLSKNDDYLVEDKLNKNKVAELAHKYDGALIDLLASHKDMRKLFFAETKSNVLVFNKDKFIQFISNKEFLPDSFTTYKNKIGLATGTELLAEHKDVVLDWPYKDCILEGGQDKEDAKRDELFFNEVLAPDQIDRLLDEKVLTGFKQYDKDGKHEIKEIGDDDNLIIRGNNLLALHSLKKRYTGKVKLIYIDPPYNTGSDSFGYNDKFNHSTWLTFMKNRLSVAKQLLSVDGVIFVQCDDNEQAYLKVLMDEVFGRENFISNLLWKGRGGRQDSKHIAQMHEFIVAYAKDATVESINKRTITDASSYPNVNKDERRYKTQLVRKWGSNSRQIDRPNLFYEVEFEGHKVVPLLPNGENGCWRWSKKKLEAEIAKDNIIGSEKNDRYELYEKVFEGDGTKDIVASSWIDDISSGTGSKHLADLFGGKEFDYPKPEELMGRLIELATDEGDIVLDYHLGSGTTTTAAHKLGRQYIGIEQMSYIEDVTVERLKKVIGGEQGGISKQAEWNGGGSFVYCHLMDLGNKFIEKVKHATTDKELENLLEQAKKSSFLSYKVDPEKINPGDKDFKDLSMAHKKQLLLELVDQNHLYVNYSEIDDTDYGVSSEDKKLNRQFYGN